MRLIYVTGVTLIALLSILIGVVIGISSSKEVLESMELIQTLSSIGTLVVAAFTAFIAFVALYTWKFQFDHAEKFKALVALEIELKELFLSFDNYLASYIKNVVDCDKPANYESNEQEYHGNSVKFSRTLDFACSFLSDEDSSKLNMQYEKTRKLFKSAFNMADSNHKTTQVSQFGAIRRKKDKEIEEQYTVFKEILRSNRR